MSLAKRTPLNRFGARLRRQVDALLLASSLSRAAGFRYLNGEKIISFEVAIVTDNGEVTLPEALRQQLGIRQGSKVEFSLVGDHLEMRVATAPTSTSSHGFGMLRSTRPAIPADFDPASLITPL